MWEAALNKIITSASLIDSEWIKRKRKIDTIKLFTCTVSALHHNISLRSLIDTIDNCNFTFAAYQKAMHRCPVEMFAKLYHKLVHDIKSKRSRVLAIDGSRIPLTKCQQGTLSGRTRSTPTGLLSCIHDVHNNTIVHLDFNQHYDERAALIRSLLHVKANDTLLMDRGYYSNKLVKVLHDQGVKFVFRMKDKVGLNNFVPLGRNVYRTPSGVPVAVNKYVAGGTCFRVLHSIQIPSTRAKELYKMRWNVEETFKTLKCTIRIKAVHFKQHAASTFSKQMWMCACLHHLQSVIIHKHGAAYKTKPCNSNRPRNGVQIVAWLIYKLSGGRSTSVRFNVVYSVVGDRRLRPKTVMY